MKPALGEVASQLPRVSPVTAAWRVVAAWLLKLLRALSAAPEPGMQWDSRAQCSICKVIRRFRRHKWADLGAHVDADSFRYWYDDIQRHRLLTRQYVVILRLEAHQRAKAAGKYDLEARRRSWQTWLQEGPAKGLGRQHRMSRVVGGWVPSPVGHAALAGEIDDDLAETTKSCL